MDTHIVYHIDEDLSIISREISDHFDAIAVREDGHYQGDAFLWGEGITDQPFPGWDVTAHEKVVKSMNVYDHQNA